MFADFTGGKEVPIDVAEVRVFTVTKDKLRA